MSGPATKMHEALGLIQDAGRGRCQDCKEKVAWAVDGVADITPEQLAVMDVAADVLAMDDGRPLLPHQALLISALKVEMERRKEGGT